MSGLNSVEVEALANVFQSQVGYHIDRFYIDQKSFAFGLWSGTTLLWYYGELENQAPFLLPVNTLPKKFSREKKPLTLFFHAHLADAELSGVEFRRDVGRVIVLRFKGERSIEVRLFPHGQNLIFKHQDRQVSFLKPKELPVMQEVVDEREGRSLRLLAEDLIWKQRSAVRVTEDPKSKDVSQEELTKKRRKILAKMGEDLSLKNQLPWRQLGDWLAEHRSLKVPEKFDDFVVGSESLTWNIDKAYSLAKKNDAKIKSIKERMTFLQMEILDLESGKSIAKQGQRKVARKNSMLKDVGAKGRTQELSDGIALFVGKNSKDNLRLLRKARAWDLWIHIKDMPSSHGIIRREKNQKISDADLQKAFQFFLAHSFGARSKKMSGERFELQVAECRFVQPIKGDKIGRVTVRNEKVYSARMV